MFLRFSQLTRKITKENSHVVFVSFKNGLSIFTALSVLGFSHTKNKFKFNDNEYFAPRRTWNKVVYCNMLQHIYFFQTLSVFKYICIYHINRYVKQDTPINTIPDFLSQCLKENHYMKWCKKTIIIKDKWRLISGLPDYYCNVII